MTVPARSPKTVRPWRFVPRLVLVFKLLVTAGVAIASGLVVEELLILAGVAANVAFYGRLAVAVVVAIAMVTWLRPVNALNQIIADIREARERA